MQDLFLTQTVLCYLVKKRGSIANLRAWHFYCEILEKGLFGHHD